MKQEAMGWQWHQLDHNANYLHVASDRPPRQHLITQFFTDWMLFLMASQQRQRTEGNTVVRCPFFTLSICPDTHPDVQLFAGPCLFFVH